MKSLFLFTKEQRSGIFLLLLIIIALQCVYFFAPISSKMASKDVSANNKDFIRFSRELDSMRLVELESRKPKIFPYNPNFLTDYKGTLLGMSNQEIDRLLAFRKQNLWINSAKQFQEVTKISDSLLEKMSPYFKFPDWIANGNSKNKPVAIYHTTSSTKIEKHDLNTATEEQLQKVYGVGAVLSQRIIKYRNKLNGGFVSDNQLHDIYGLTPETVTNIKKDFTVKSSKIAHKLILNRATVEELVTLPYIDYNLAHRIIEQRQLREGYRSLDELTKVKDFPINKIDIIKLYLSLD